MSESLWESEVAVEAETEVSEFEPQAEEAIDEAPEPESAPEAQPEKPRSYTLSVDEFAGLEARVLRAVTLVKQERQARIAAEERAAKAEAALSEQAERAEQTQAELAALRGEREQVKTRVERLLEQLDGLEL